MIGDELLQYANATDLGDDLYRLDTFLRGLRNTDYHMDTHKTNENFVRLNSNIVRIATSKTDVNRTPKDTFVALSANSSSFKEEDFYFSDTGNSLRPPPVYVTRIFRNVNGDIEIDWYPRVRQNGLWENDDDVVLSANDTPETYSVDVCQGTNDSGFSDDDLIPSIPVTSGTFPLLNLLEFRSQYIAADDNPYYLSNEYNGTHYETIRGLSHQNVETPVIATYAGTTGSLSGSFVYTASQQDTDYGSSGGKHPVYLVIYQVSGLSYIGRGYGIGVCIA
jgi:hypothetical protein